MADGNQYIGKTSDEIMKEFNKRFKLLFEKIKCNKYSDDECLQEFINLRQSIQRNITQAKINELYRLHYMGKPFYLTEQGIGVRKRIEYLQKQLGEI